MQNLSNFKTCHSLVNVLLVLFTVLGRRLKLSPAGKRGEEEDVLDRTVHQKSILIIKDEFPNINEYL